MSNQNSQIGRKIIVAALVLIVVAAGYFWQQHRSASARNESQVRQIVNSEELLLELSPKLKHLSRSVLNLQLPDPTARAIFADSVAIQNRLTFADDSPSVWTILDDSETKSKDDIHLFRALFAKARFFRNVKFYNIKGEFVEDEQNSQNRYSRFETLVGFSGLANLEESLASIDGQLRLVWQTSSEGPNTWQIAEWKLKKFQSDTSAKRYFKDELIQRVREPVVIERASRSKHRELTTRLVNGGDYFLPKGVKYPFFFPDVTLEHPGVSVVDIDRDGYLDIYVAMQHGSNLLFHNQGDGTYSEAAKKFGLAIPGDSTCALFADFDNDGDADVFIGRGRQSSLYLVNENGRFVDTKEWIETPLPTMVSSISAADINSDGLLDVYISTYSPIEAEYASNRTPQWVDLFMSKEQAKEYLARQVDSHPFLARTGPPNLLLKNKGGGEFQIAAENESLELWKMTFQASWHDYDDDGDPDLYVANDYHKDNFFRNDGGAGFTDVTAEAGLTGMGFGMGVTFGDYDLDGQTDIYVSNMFSKAGQRILSQVDNIDSRLQEMANGNFLYKKTRAGYQLVSGLSEDKVSVAKAGWSWGGQFADFDNDGYRDIYVVNGYYTAPDDVAVDIDL